MKFIVYYLLLVLLVNIKKINGSINCTYNGVDYSTLYSNTYYQSTDSNGYTYYFNICGLASICGSSSIAACQYYGSPQLNSIGSLSSYQFGSSGGSTYLKYSNGDHCGNGVYRSLIIHFNPITYSPISISDVVESSMCTYEVTVTYDPPSTPSPTPTYYPTPSPTRNSNPINCIYNGVDYSSLSTQTYYQSTDSDGEYSYYFNICGVSSYCGGDAACQYIYGSNELVNIGTLSSYQFGSSGGSTYLKYSNGDYCGNGIYRSLIIHFNPTTYSQFSISKVVENSMCTYEVTVTFNQSTPTPSPTQYPTPSPTPSPTINPNPINCIYNGVDYSSLSTQTYYQSTDSAGEYSYYFNICGVSSYCGDDAACQYIYGSNELVNIGTLSSYQFGSSGGSTYLKYSNGDYCGNGIYRSLIIHFNPTTYSQFLISKVVESSMCIYEVTVTFNQSTPTPSPTSTPTPIPNTTYPNHQFNKFQMTYNGIKEGTIIDLFSCNQYLGGGYFKIFESEGLINYYSIIGYSDYGCNILSNFYIQSTSFQCEDMKILFFEMYSIICIPPSSYRNSDFYKMSVSNIDSAISLYNCQFSHGSNYSLMFTPYPYGNNIYYITIYSDSNCFSPYDYYIFHCSLNSNIYISQLGVYIRCYSDTIGYLGLVECGGISNGMVINSDFSYILCVNGDNQLNQYCQGNNEDSNCSYDPDTSVYNCSLTHSPSSKYYPQLSVACSSTLVECKSVNVVCSLSKSNSNETEFIIDDRIMYGLENDSFSTPVYTTNSSSSLIISNFILLFLILTLII